MAGKAGEIGALLNLIEDPDDSVYQTVSTRLIEMGVEVIPALEQVFELEDDPIQLEKVNQIISNILLNRLEHSIQEWYNTEEKSILEGAFFIHEYIARTSDKTQFFFEIEKVRKSIWLELNHYLTPLEEINIFNKILFAHFQYLIKDLNHSELKHYDLNNLLTRKSSNSYPSAALYMILADMLGIKLEPVNIPKHNLIAYLDTSDSLDYSCENDLLFFLDPASGQVYSHKDIQSYLEKINSSEKKPVIKQNARVEYLKKWLMEIALFEKRYNSVFAYNRIIEITNLI